MAGASWTRTVGLMALPLLTTACVFDVHIHLDGRDESVDEAEQATSGGSGFEILEFDDHDWLVPPGTLSPSPDGSVVGDALWRSWEWEQAGLHTDAVCNRIVPTLFDLAPVITNRDEVAEAKGVIYPERLRKVRISSGVDVWMCIDGAGRVRRAELDGTSGDAEVDRAALYVANMMEFTPPEYDDAPVMVWIRMPINFSAP